MEGRKIDERNRSVNVTIILIALQTFKIQKINIVRSS